MLKFLSAFAASAVLASAFLVGCKPSEPTPGNGATGTSSTGADKIKIGFVVKQMDDTWFQQETKFATEKASELGIDLLVQEAKNGEAVLSAIETLATQGAKGLIICSPEVQLGTSIQKACESHNMKLMSVDDRLVGTDGKPLATIPHLGISAENIGKLVGKSIVDEMKVRGWKMDEAGAIAILKEGLETAELRVKGTRSELEAAGLPAAKIFIGPWTGAVDITAASNAANTIITRESATKKWVVFSSNDDGMMGAVRSLENAGIPVENIIGVGINGTTAAQDFKKKMQTGVFASVLLSPRTHGAQTVEMMAAWIKDGQSPEMETYTAGTVINRANYVEEMKKEGVLP